MFREVTRKKQALSNEVCVSILKQELRGVLSVIGDDGYPYGMPMNHWYNEEDGRLYFHSGMSGHKVDAMKQCAKASFCVMDKGIRAEDDWALNFQSVIVFGRLEIVEDPDRAIEMIRALSNHFTDDSSYVEHEIQQAAKRTLCFCLIPEHMTGKRVNEK
ncbi:MAG: pyridoxamine 5'-phosphate oxidase family protein [Oscillospiraceae bacterium]|nr:pyridoxamine 5'-phosphate oxidase family protein [Oscillospiraceae bacterium]